MEYYKNLLQLLLSPTCGWEDVSGSMPRPMALARSRMLPLFAVAALSQLMALAYDSAQPLDVALIRGASVFVSLLMAFFIGKVGFDWMLPAMVEGEPNSRKADAVVVYAMGLMALAYTVPALLPVSLALNYILPIGVALVAMKASAYLRVKPHKTGAFFVLCLVTMSLSSILVQELVNYTLKTV